MNLWNYQTSSWVQIAGYVGTNSTYDVGEDFLTPVENGTELRVRVTLSTSCSSATYARYYETEVMFQTRVTADTAPSSRSSTLEWVRPRSWWAS